MCGRIIQAKAEIIVPHKATNTARNLRQKLLEIQVANESIVDLQQRLETFVFLGQLFLIAPGGLIRQGRIYANGHLCRCLLHESQVSGLIRKRLLARKANGSAAAPCGGNRKSIKRLDTAVAQQRDQAAEPSLVFDIVQQQRLLVLPYPPRHGMLDGLLQR